MSFFAGGKCNIVANALTRRSPAGIITNCNCVANITLEWAVKTEVPVFIFAGFLDSGKTTALQGTLLKTRRPGEGKAVIICTEEGEEEFKAEALHRVSRLLVDTVQHPHAFIGTGKERYCAKRKRHIPLSSKVGKLLSNKKKYVPSFVSWHGLEGHCCKFAYF